MPDFLLTFVLTEDTTGTYSCLANNTFGAIASHAKVTMEGEIISIAKFIIKSAVSKYLHFDRLSFFQQTKTHRIYC